MSRDKIEKLIETGHELTKGELKDAQADQPHRIRTRRLRFVLFASTAAIAIAAGFYIVIAGDVAGGRTAETAPSAGVEQIASSDAPADHATVPAAPAPKTSGPDTTSESPTAPQGPTASRGPAAPQGPAASESPAVPEGPTSREDRAARGASTGRDASTAAGAAIDEPQPGSARGREARDHDVPAEADPRSESPPAASSEQTSVSELRGARSPHADEPPATLDQPSGGTGDQREMDQPEESGSPEAARRSSQYPGLARAARESAPASPQPRAATPSTTATSPPAARSAAPGIVSSTDDAGPHEATADRASQGEGREGDPARLSERWARPALSEEQWKAELRAAFAPPARSSAVAPAAPHGGADAISPTQPVAPSESGPEADAESAHSAGSTSSPDPADGPEQVDPPVPTAAPEPATASGTGLGTVAATASTGEAMPDSPAPSRQPEPRRREQRPENLTTLIRIPGGEVPFGAISADQAAMENELPRTTITVDTFYLEEHEVTNRQYKDFVDATGYQPVPRSDDPRFAEYDWDRETRTYPSGQGDYPVVNVTLPDARAYAKWAGRRLPTELEWEYAARQSRESALYPWGNSLANRLFGNFDGSRLLPVASYPPNELGLYDLAGNAFEWMGHGYVEDLHEQLEAGRDIQILLATTETRYALLRGGAFYSTAREIRNSYREYNDASVRYPGYSFRLAADAP